MCRLYFRFCVVGLSPLAGQDNASKLVIGDIVSLVVDGLSTGSFGLHFLLFDQYFAAVGLESVRR